MDAQATEGLLRFFRDIQDLRADNARHEMGDVITIAILAVICGAEGWAAVEAWGRGNRQWLGTFLDLPHGIPSHDTFDRIFALLDPLAFERCFTDLDGGAGRGGQGAVRRGRRQDVAAQLEAGVEQDAGALGQRVRVEEPGGARAGGDRRQE